MIGLSLCSFAGAQTNGLNGGVVSPFYANGIITNGSTNVTLSGTFSGNGVGLTNVGYNSNYWFGITNPNALLMSESYMVATMPTPVSIWDSFYAQGSPGTEFKITNAITAAFVGANAVNMKQYGLQVFMTECWGGYQDTNGLLHENLTNYPDGMAFVANYVHTNGYKFGLYTEFNTNIQVTTAGMNLNYPGGHNYVLQI